MPPSNIQACIPTQKDPLPTLDKSGIYSIECECGEVYIGQTKRTVQVRKKEHQYHTRRGELEKSAIAEHCWKNDHKMHWDSTKVIAQPKSWFSRNFVEALEIEKADNSMNHNDGYQVPLMWRENIVNKHALKKSDGKNSFKKPAESSSTVITSSDLTTTNSSSARHHTSSLEVTHHHSAVLHPS